MRGLPTSARQCPARSCWGWTPATAASQTDGWEQDSGEDVLEVARKMATLPITAIIYTDIATDGMLTGPNVPAMARMQAEVGVPVVASGGVAAAEDVARLAEAGMAGAIIGRALYESRITIEEALAAADTGRRAPR